MCILLLKRILRQYMKNKERDLVRLHHILDAIKLIQEFTADISYDQFAEDLMNQNAVIRQFEIK